MFPLTPGLGDGEVREARGPELAPPPAVTVTGPGQEDPTMEGGIGQGSYTHFLLFTFTFRQKEQRT